MNKNKILTEKTELQKQLKIIMEKIKLLVFLCLLSISNVFTQISNEDYYLLTENADNLIENEQFDKALLIQML